MQFPPFVEFAQATGTKKTAKSDGKALDHESEPTAKNKTPEELIGAAYGQLHATLRKEVLDLAGRWTRSSLRNS